VAGAFSIVIVDLGIRTARWKVLLRSLAAGNIVPPFVMVAAYLSIGYLANSVLPARLGDIARAYLAGSGFRLSRAATLGTILVERVADGATMLGLALVSSFIVTSVVEVRALVAYAGALAIVAVLAIALIRLGLSRGTLAGRRYPQLASAFASRVARGLAGIQTIPGALTVGGLTLAAAATAVGIGWSVATAAGIPLSLVQAILFTSGIAMSLAIPAAPASLGTYEFVGVAILSSFGASAEQALASILMMRLVSALPLSILGLAAVWILHIRPAELIRSAQDLSLREDQGVPD
jgi:hypothetical protein